jgi:oligopeptide/dipeptide ABC transporter ATP-binding protein
VNTLFTSPLHPYTKALLSATPIPNPKTTRNLDRIILSGDVPSPMNIPVGCRFNTRCPYAFEKCREEEPILKKNEESCVACHLYSGIGSNDIIEGY